VRGVLHFLVVALPVPGTGFWVRSWDTSTTPSFRGGEHAPGSAGRSAQMLLCMLLYVPLRMLLQSRSKDANLMVLDP
jgi:hypothetical protein